MTRKGKIARLAHPIREQINRRLQNGEKNGQIVEWLNALPEVVAVMAAEFGGEAIIEMNVSNWRKGGYRDWEAAQPSVEAIQSVADRADAIKENAPEGLIDQMAVVVSSLMAKQLISSDAGGNARKQFAELNEWLMRFSRLRRSEFHSQRLAIGRERLELLRQKTKQEFEEQYWKWAAQDHIRKKICKGFCFTAKETRRRSHKILEIAPPDGNAPSAESTANGTAAAEGKS